jgi:hypothetical protein
MTGSASLVESSLLAPDPDAKLVQAFVGGACTIHLWEDRTRGELWVPSYDARALALVGDEFLRIASNNAVDAGRRTFEFKPVKAGVHRVVFEKRMGWKCTAEDRRVFLIRADEESERLGGG